MVLYLDYNATTPLHPAVLDQMIAVYRDNYGNAGSRTHVYGERASAAVELARTQVASTLGVDKSEVIFTSGATESDNLALLGLAAWGWEHGRRHIVSTPIEHKAVLEPLAYLSSKGFDVELAPVGVGGRVRAEDVLARVRRDTLLVSVMHANNETGVVQPVHEIGAALKSTNTYFHVDAAQTFGKLVPELRKLDYDLLSLSGHKIRGPQGIGALVVRKRGYQRPPLQPLTYGGGQEGRLRPGTVPVALVAGLGAAAEIAVAEANHWRSACQAIKDSVLRQLEQVEHYVNGDLVSSMPNCLNVSFPGIDSEALMLALRGELAVSNGSACTSADYRPSHVLEAMKLDDRRLSSAIRLSWGSGDTDGPSLTPLVTAVMALR